MQNQAQYDRAVKLLEELEEILGCELQIWAYDGEDPRDELWRKFATEEEKAERHKKRQEEIDRWYQSTPYGKIVARTAVWAEEQMLEHAEPLLVLSRFKLSGNLPNAQV